MEKKHRVSCKMGAKSIPKSIKHHNPYGAEQVTQARGGFIYLLALLLLYLCFSNWRPIALSLSLSRSRSLSLSSCLSKEKIYIYTSAFFVVVTHSLSLSALSHPIVPFLSLSSSLSYSLPIFVSWCCSCSSPFLPRFLSIALALSLSISLSISLSLCLSLSLPASP